MTLATEVQSARRLLRCAQCELWFFNIVLRSDVLRELLDKPSVRDRWSTQDRSTFQRARQAMRRFHGDTGSLLDIGAHSGGFLDTVPHSWNKSAVEPMMAASATIAGVDVHAGFLEQVELGTERYDCITAFDVVEHFADPALAFAKVAQALRPGGIFVIETGTVDAMAAKLLRSGWYYVNFLEHFQAFGRRSIQAVLERAGLQCAQLERVVPEYVDPAAKIARAGVAVVYAGLTGLGRTNHLWHGIHAVLRPLGAALPPTTIGLEPDHQFVVAVKPATGPA